MKSEDEIMADHLLHGGRMLARACPDCGCPLFEVKGETSCVVCAARRAPQGSEPVAPASAVAAVGIAGPAPATAPASGLLSDELEATIACLLQRARAEPDPERCRTLMESVRIGWGLLR